MIFYTGNNKTWQYCKAYMLLAISLKVLSFKVHISQEQPPPRRRLLSRQHKKKPKAVPLHTMKALGGERKYSSYSFSTSALDGGEWSAPGPGRALGPGKGPQVLTG
jgi:hypothetical protein